MNQVRGWLTQREALALQELAAGKVVLEVGSYCGLSSLLMAQVAVKVVCVDHFRGDEFTGPCNVRDEFLRNVDGCKAWGRIVAMIGSQEDVLPLLDLRQFGLIFYDADHSYPATKRGIELLGNPPGVVAFHDYDADHPGVLQAVNEYLADTGRYKVASKEDSLLIAVP